MGFRGKGLGLRIQDFGSRVYGQGMIVPDTGEATGKEKKVENELVTGVLLGGSRDYRYSSEHINGKSSGCLETGSRVI